MKENIIEIPCGDEELVIKCVEEFNENYETNFRVLNVEVRDGVMFVIVERADASLSEVCMLGFFHGAKIQKMRMEGKIQY